MDKTIIVAFENNEQRKEKKGLAQWDKGMTLKVYGLETTDKVQVHFSLNNICGDAKAVEATIENDAIVAKIPQFILEGPTGIRYQRTYNAYAFIYLYDEDSAETVKRIIFEVETRPKPVDYVHSEEELKEWTKLEQKIKNQSTQFENEQKKQDNVISEKISRPASAKVGQMLVVEAVDEDEKPTKWKVIAPPECKVKSVNGNQPDENGNISIETSGVKTVNEQEPDENGNVDIKIPECKVKTVNETEPDENGNIEIEAGVRSWNDLEGKPFYEEVTKTNVLEWDGNTDGKLCIPVDSVGGCYYKVSDVVPTNDDLKNGCTVYTNFGQTLSIGEVYDQFVEDGFITEDYANLQFAFIVRKENFEIEGVVFKEKGVYFIHANIEGMEVYANKFECANPIFTSTSIKKLDNKYLDMDWIPKEIPAEVVLTDTPVQFDSSILPGISLPPLNLVSGETYTVIVDGEKFVLKAETLPSDYVLVDWQNGIGLVANTSTGVIMIINKADGSCVVSCADTLFNTSHVISIVKGEGAKITPLPEKFLPKEAIKAIAEEVVLGGAW